uniref:NadR/Ttd14 AAA domain-containing protein n=1 Tax=Chromera velia CCMP2878 TaxID=1169474 RepID=A0A0G4FYK5_9ALVE|eukprot:Cvel_3895.t1-p1 / transcript=Cvel_3895.t1 / gene=Cvel_3895 / organism=Chromera_velia_CCMP2878 / gene_product=Cytochrome P450 19A1, putative / transcript_product=Cytochrome P450 19A1, putative / location=Cvel_scaffold165:21665-24089(-) / protein_length=720 / sequence_SO=supercontig / SO=protein_coding / is_pseudo=false
MGSSVGMERMGMHKNGLIWNYDVDLWKKNRKAFEKALEEGQKELDQQGGEYMAQGGLEIPLIQPVSMLDRVRDFTICLTLQCLLRLPSLTSDSQWKKNTIAIVGGYFKAWEFHLFSTQSSDEHTKAIDLMREKGEEIVRLWKEQNQGRRVEEEGREGGRESFLGLLHKIHESSTSAPGGWEGTATAAEIRQNTCEMLLAGTDTTSLTLFYSLVLASTHPRLAAMTTPRRSKGERGREVLPESEESGSVEAIKRLFYEAQRLIPVGPVSLREAIVDIPEVKLGSGEHSVRQGDGVIFNIERMNRDPRVYSDPDSFCPDRYIERAKGGGGEPFPLSFGTGSKSCPGRFFAEKEARIYLSSTLSRFSFFTENGEGLEVLKPKWDVANAPSTDLKLWPFPRADVYLTGQSSTGKTTTLEAIRKQFPMIPYVSEVAREVMRERGWTPEDLSRSKEIHLDLQEQLLEKNEAIFRERHAQPFRLIDRSPVDILFYLEKSHMKSERGKEIHKRANALAREVAESPDCLILHFPFRRDTVKRDGVCLMPQEDDERIMEELADKFSLVRLRGPRVTLEAEGGGKREGEGDGWAVGASEEACGPSIDERTKEVLDVIRSRFERPLEGENTKQGGGGSASSLFEKQEEEEVACPETPTVSPSGGARVSSFSVASPERVAETADALAAEEFDEEGMPTDHRGGFSSLSSSPSRSHATKTVLSHLKATPQRGRK